PCSTASNSPRSTPGSSPSLRRRVLGGGKASEGEGGVGGADSPLPSVPSASSLPSAYPLASRHFSRNPLASEAMSAFLSQVLSPTYKQRNEDFRKIFKKLPDSERLIVDYSCALQKDILLQGRLYLSENWLCFYSNIFRWETTITIQLKDVTSMTKEKTAKLIPNAIQISTDSEKHFFTSFGARERSFMMIFRLWQNALLDKSLSPKELWHIVHQCYGTELGLTSEDDDYVSPTSEHINGLCDQIISDKLQQLCSAPRPVSHQSHDPGPCAPPPLLLQTLEEGGDSQPESTNHMPPPPAASLGNLSSLDITNDEELPTDPSNSSDTQEESKSCLNSGKRFCCSQRGVFTSKTHGTSSRVLSYTIALNNPLGPKTAPVVETQVRFCSCEGECYVVDSEVITSGIPYQDYFYTVHRYCLTSISKHKSRLRVSSDICYRKQPWSLVKALIEKNTWSGIEDYYRNMGEAQRRHQPSSTPPSLRRRKRACSRRQSEREGGGVEAGDRGERGVGEERNRREASNLVVLVALNMLLFYKLYALERAAHTLERWRFPTAGEWAQVLHLQRQFHQAQLSKWQQILQSSVSLLDQMKHSLEKLHRNIVVPDGEPDPPADTETLSET
uniref:GRAM domain containing 1A n=1 Tax=Xiphophorus couchianus TaxID=32473 RepID=A0A3B5KJB4_9TELE